MDKIGQITLDWTELGKYKMQFVRGKFRGKTTKG